MNHADKRTANLLGSLSLAVADRLRVATEDAAGHSGSGPAALTALSTHLDGSDIDTLRRTVGLTHSAAVRLVDRLEEAGLVDRRRGPDGRSVAVVLTKAGRKRGRDALVARERVLQEILEVLSPAKQQELTELCESLLRGLTTSRADAVNICRLCQLDVCGHAEGRCPVTQAADESSGGLSVASQ